jgi:hypothetical protein
MFPTAGDTHARGPPARHRPNGLDRRSRISCGMDDLDQKSPPHPCGGLCAALLQLLHCSVVYSLAFTAAALASLSVPLRMAVL